MMDDDIVQLSTEFGLRRSISMLQDDPKAAKEAFHAVAAGFCPHCGVKHRTITPDQCADRHVSERTLQTRVVDRAKRRGWKVAHAGRGIAAFDKAGQPIFLTAMSKGWPDLFLLNVKQRRALAIELKREEGEVEPEQIEWLQAMNACGVPAVVIRPSDLREGRVNAILGPQ
jgi:hypothetical protein